MRGLRAGGIKMKQILQKIRQDLRANVEEKFRVGAQRYFKDEVRVYGVRTGIVVRVAKKYWSEIKDWPKKEIFMLCEELQKTEFLEEAFIVSAWCPKLADRFEKKDLAVFRKWMDKYICNWAECDGFCNHTIGDFIEKFPESLKEVKSWAKSKNRWMRRASAVSLIIPAKRGKLLKDVFEIADVLLKDKEDMVQKGYGWMLKEASRLHQKEVFDYVMAHKKEMPRTALRYAIELMPRTLKIKAMAK